MISIVRTLSTATAALVATTAITVGSAAVASSPAAAAPACTRYAAASGLDTNAGTQAAPYRSLAKLLQMSRPGDVGCLQAGDRFDQLITVQPGATPRIDPTGASVVTASGTAGAPITIRSTDGGRAKIGGQIHVDATGHDLTFDGIDFVGLSSAKSTHLNLDGDRIVVRNSDISNPRGLCIDIGGFPANNAYQSTSAGDPAVGVVLDGNRIHHCGTDPSLAWSATDSGAHGVYIVNAQATKVTNNAIYDNKYRGLQTWPKGEGTLVEGNVFDGNAQNVNIGSALTEGYPWFSRDTIVRNNLITNATLWNPGKNQSQVHGYFPNDGLDRGNRVTGNCLFGTDPAKNFSGFGYAQSGNVVADPGYRDRAVKDFRLSASSPCLGKGPNWAQPTSGSAVDVSTSLSGVPSAASTGGEATVTATVTNRGAAPTTATLRLPVPAGATLLAAASGCTSASGVLSCSVTLPVGGSVALANRLGWTRAGTATLVATVGAAGDADRSNDSASSAVSVSGAACTIVGTDASSSVQGTDGPDVFCGFGGDDTFVPGAGNDVVLGGTGIDRVSYWNAGAAVVANLGQQAAWDRASTTAIGWDTFSGIEVVFGSAFGDLLVGGAGADVLHGLEGNDELWGYGGDDALYGGMGDDTINGGDGSDLCTQDAGAGGRTACER